MALKHALGQSKKKHMSKISEWFGKSFHRFVALLDVHCRKFEKEHWVIIISVKQACWENQENFNIGTINISSLLYVIHKSEVRRLEALFKNIAYEIKPLQYLLFLSCKGLKREWFYCSSDLLKTFPSCLFLLPPKRAWISTVSSNFSNSPPQPHHEFIVPNFQLRFKTSEDASQQNFHKHFPYTLLYPGDVTFLLLVNIRFFV